MLLSLLLVAMLDAQVAPPRPAPASPAGEAPAAPAPTHDEAAALADAGELDASLRAFQRIAAANPDDRSARLWIANLQMAMHRPERAEPVYRSILLEEPANLRARVGVALSLNAREEYEEALQVLDVAEEEAPENPAVLIAAGEAYEGLRQAERAIDYYERAVAVAPTADNRWRLEQARRAFAHRVEASGLVERFDNDAPVGSPGTELEFAL